MGWIASVINNRLRGFDLFMNRTDFPWLRGHTVYSLLLPALVVFLASYGTWLPFTARAGLPLWCALAFALLVLSAALAHKVPFTLARYMHFAVIAGMTWLTFRLADGNQLEHSDKPFEHTMGYFAVFVLGIGMLVSQLLAWLLFRVAHDEMHEYFHECVDETELFRQPTKTEWDWRALIRAVFMAPIQTPILLLWFVSVGVLVCGPRGPVIGWWLVVGIVLLTISHYKYRLAILRGGVGRLLTSGAPAIVTVAVILIAICRIFGVQYVEVVMAGAPRVLGAYVLGFYVLFWLYDYWTRITAGAWFMRVLNPNNETKEIAYGKRDGCTIQMHGAGRLMAIEKSGGKTRRYESFEPIDLFSILAENAPKEAEQLPTPESLREAYDASPSEEPAAEPTFTPKQVVFVEDYKDGPGARHLRAMRRRQTIYNGILLAVLLGVMAVNVYSRFNDTKNTSIAVTNDAGDNADGTRPFDLHAKLSETNEPALLLAVSGGGSRAALFAEALMHGIWVHDPEAMRRIVAGSSVSGGGAALAYYALHKDALTAEKQWQTFQTQLTHEFIAEVVRSAPELRLQQGAHFGDVLTESFVRTFTAGGGNGGRNDTALHSITDLGLMFNTGISGSRRTGAVRRPEAAAFDVDGTNASVTTTFESGGRCVFTNIAGLSETSAHAAIQPDPDAWEMKLPYVFLSGPALGICRAAATNANFPPVFSNVGAVLKKGDVEELFWLTDGGTIDNRGVLSLLVALRITMNENDASTWRPIRILVAEASALGGVKYARDRGLGALSTSKERFANQLIAMLLDDANAKINAAREARALPPIERPIEIHYLPMPPALRDAADFGTHWMVPPAFRVRDPFELDRTARADVEICRATMLELLHAIFDQERLDGIELHGDAARVREWIQRGWTKDDPASGSLPARLKRALRP